jgi:hypothetical protein
MYRKIFCVSLIFTFGVNGQSLAQVATGGNFALEQSATAGGGGNSSGGNFGVEGTTAQSVAGIHSNSANFGIHGGFWQAFLIPTAASVSVGGRVMTPDGRAIRGVRVTLIDVGGVTRACISSDFGYYRFDEVEVGRTYLILATSKQYTFVARAVTVNDVIGDFDLIVVQ